MTLSGKGRRAKGAAFERDVANRFREVWPGAERNIAQTRTAAKEGGDVLGVPFHVECKKGRADIQAAMRQAMDDCDGSAPCVVVSCRDRAPEGVLVTMRWADWLAMASAAAQAEMPGDPIVVPVARKVSA